MRIDNLYIVGSDNFKSEPQLDKNSKIVFLENFKDEFDNQISLIKCFQKKQFFLREKWLEFQDEVFKKIKVNLDKDNDFHYLLCNLFFESSPNKTNSIYQFFKIYLILDYIKRENIKKVYLVNTPQEIEAFFVSNRNTFPFLFKVINVQKKEVSIIKLIKNLEKKNLIFSIFSCLVKEFKKLQKKYCKELKSSKVVFSYYVPGGHSFNNGFSSKFFDNVSSLLNDSYDWLFQYEGSASSYSYENKLVNSKINSYGFLDNYFSLINFPKIIIKYIKLRKKINTLKLNSIFIFEKINYCALFKSDWLISNSILLLKLLIFEKKISNFFKINPQITEVLYLLEFQPWEQILNKVAKNHKIKTKGVVHSIARPNVMNYYHSKTIHSYYHLPTYIGANSDFSKSLFFKNGFNKDQVIKVEAQRYNYLVDTSNEINHSKLINNKSILIFTSNIRKETIELLETFTLSNIKFEKVYLKEHHLLPVETIIKSLNNKFPSYEVINCTASEAFKYSDIVYIANGSSVLLESVIKNKATISLISLSSLPTPAIEEAENLYFIHDVESLSKVLYQLTSNLKKTNSQEDYKSYLYLNKDLKLWREFLKK